MTEAQRKEALARVRKLGDDARHLAVFGRTLDPARLATFVAELADEIAKILAAPNRSKHPSRSSSAEDKKAVTAVMTRLRSALRNARGKLRVVDALTLAGFTRKSHYEMTIVGRAMDQLGWDRRRCRLNGQLKYAYTKGTPLQRDNLLKLKRNGMAVNMVSTKQRSST